MTNTHMVHSNKSRAHHDQLAPRIVPRSSGLPFASSAFIVASSFAPRGPAACSCWLQAVSALAVGRRPAVARGHQQSWLAAAAAEAPSAPASSQQAAAGAEPRWSSTPPWTVSQPWRARPVAPPPVFSAASPRRRQGAACQQPRCCCRPSSQPAAAAVGRWLGRPHGHGGARRPGCRQ